MDFFLQNLTGENCLVVPPVSLIHKTIHYLYTSKAFGPTNLEVPQVFSSPDMLTGVFRAPSNTREQQPAAPPVEPIATEGIQLEEEESVVFRCPEEGCIKVYQSHNSLQRHLDAGKHLLALERESPRRCSPKTSG